MERSEAYPFVWGYASCLFASPFLDIFSKIGHNVDITGKEPTDSGMKRLKQITALIGVILLIGLYASTLVLAVIGNETSLQLLRAAIVCTVIVPVLLWAYSFIYRLLKNHFSDADHSDKKDSGSSRVT